MEEERIVLGDILTPQEHNWMGSTPEFNPTTEEEWYMPDGVLRGKITLEEAIEQRNKRGFVGGGMMAAILGIFGRDIAISLEEIDETAHRTKNDPRILGIFDRETNEITPAIDEATGQDRDLTSEFIERFRERRSEGDLRLRPRYTGEGQNLSLGEGNTDYRK